MKNSHNLLVERYFGCMELHVTNNGSTQNQ